MNTNNPFQIVDTVDNTIPLQKRIGGIIEKKKAGRPRRPNMERYLIKMDKTLHAQLSKHAESAGMNKSAVIAQAVRNHLHEFK